MARYSARTPIREATPSMTALDPYQNRQLFIDDSAISETCCIVKTLNRPQIHRLIGEMLFSDLSVGPVGASIGD